MNENELIDADVKSWIDNNTYWSRQDGISKFKNMLINKYGYYKMTADQVLSHFD